MDADLGREVDRGRAVGRRRQRDRGIEDPCRSAEHEAHLEIEIDGYGGKGVARDRAELAAQIAGTGREDPLGVAGWDAEARLDRDCYRRLDCAETEPQKGVAEIRARIVDVASWVGHSRRQKTQIPEHR